MARGIIATVGGAIRGGIARVAPRGPSNARGGFEKGIGMPQPQEITPRPTIPKTEGIPKPQDTGPTRAQQINAALQAVKGNIARVLEGLARRSIPPPLSSLETPSGKGILGTPPQGPTPEQPSVDQQQVGGGPKPEAAPTQGIAEVKGTPAEGMDKDLRYEQIREELTPKWKEEFGSIQGEESRTRAELRRRVEQVFRERYPDDAKGYDEKEKTRIYEDPVNDPAYRRHWFGALRDGGKIIQEKEQAQGKELSDAEKDQIREDVEKQAFLTFTTRYPEKAAAYGENIENKRQAALEQQRQVARSNAILNAKNFEELGQTLQESGGIQGSQRFYPASELQELIDKVRKGEEPIDVLTRDVRGAVINLLAKEKKIGESVVRPADSEGAAVPKTVSRVDELEEKYWNALKESDRIQESMKWDPNVDKDRARILKDKALTLEQQYRQVLADTAKQEGVIPATDEQILILVDELDKGYALNPEIPVDRYVAERLQLGESRESLRNAARSRTQEEERVDTLYTAAYQLTYAKDPTQVPNQEKLKPWFDKGMTKDEVARLFQEEKEKVERDHEKRSAYSYALKRLVEIPRERDELTQQAVAAESGENVVQREATPARPADTADTTPAAAGPETQTESQAREALRVPTKVANSPEYKTIYEKLLAEALQTREEVNTAKIQEQARSEYYNNLAKTQLEQGISDEVTKDPLYQKALEKAKAEAQQKGESVDENKVSQDALAKYLYHKDLLVEYQQATNPEKKKTIWQLLLELVGVAALSLVVETTGEVEKGVTGR